MIFFFCLNRRHGMSLVFFFQAEDGIRDATVTGVQTCARPILLAFGGLRWDGSGPGLQDVDSGPDRGPQEGTDEVDPEVRPASVLEQRGARRGAERHSR